MRIYLLCAFLLGTLPLIAQTARLQGKVLDENLDGEPVPFANIILLKGDEQVAGTTSDLDGNYNFSNIQPGTYNALISYVGLPNLQINNLELLADKVTIRDFTFPKQDGGILLETIVVEDVKPIVETNQVGGGAVRTAEEIKTLGTRSIRDVKSMTARIQTKDNAAKLNAMGSRSSSNDVYVDGVRMNSGGVYMIPETEVKTKKIPESGVPSKEPLTGEQYGHFVENGFITTTNENTSTFSIDVDRASYSNMRRYLQQQNELPPKDAVRIEEFINYFDYQYPQPTDHHPLAMYTEISDCPWNKEVKLLRLGMQAKTIETDKAAAQNLVFLIDVSGSMSHVLPLVKESLKLLINTLREQDRVAIVVYAGAAGLVLPSTNNKTKLAEAIDRLEAGGSTAGGQGILLAYQTAKNNFIKEGNNRVILATDGDFNVGVSSEQDLENLIVEKRKEQIFLTVLGYGTGNYKDQKMEILADKGNGNYAYIDNIDEAKKMLIKEMSSTLYTVAKDVKLQLVFNTHFVLSYRLVGYENRLLKKEDFKNDKKDAGELGAGHTVTALYEVVLAPHLPQNADLVTVKMRYKPLKSNKSILMQQIVNQQHIVPLEQASENFRFAASVAGFGMLLRQSKFQKEASFDTILALAQSAKGEDKEGYRAEFINLLFKAKTLATTTLATQK